MNRSSLFNSSIVPLRIVFLMWLMFSLEAYYGWPLSVFGIIPRTLPGVIGIVTSPLLHGNIFHLLSNTVPMLFLGSVLYFFYPRLAPTVFFRAYFWTNLLVWLFARPNSIHIGASGIVYALAFFLIFFGIFYRDFRSLIITVVVFMLYGGVFYGILPGDPHVSWESHFAGALVGIGSALTLSRKV
ncbi:MAG TPA: rhomboid family intramembrane serine protease [Cyclobacteriaceae bacterium]|nr:rhomboid family intramembrane serine protease [Cyclobacteriaceae bacterium]